MKIRKWVAVIEHKGQLKSLRQYFDTARGMQQLGLMSQPAANRA